jgi:hypothetical protein
VADRMVWAAGGWPGGGGPAAAGQGSVPVRRGVPLGTVGARPGRGAAPLPHVLEATAHAHRLRAVPDRAVQVLAIVAAVLLRWASAQLVILPGVGHDLPAPLWPVSPTRSARTPTGHTLPRAELRLAAEPELASCLRHGQRGRHVASTPMTGRD